MILDRHGNQTGIETNPLYTSSITLLSDTLTLTHTTFSVTTVSQTVIDENSKRKYLLLINDSDTVMYLNLTGNTASANFGIRLNASGGSYEMLLGNISIKGITAIHGGIGNKTLLITEGE